MEHSDTVIQLIWHTSDVLKLLSVMATIVVVVILIIRFRTGRIQKRSELILAALEKDPHVDAIAMIEQLDMSRKSLKQQLLSKLGWGIGLTVVGVVIIVTAVISSCTTNERLYLDDTPGIYLIFGAIPLAIGVALLTYYLVARHKVLKKELEEEQHTH